MNSPDAQTIETLTRIFRDLGARKPEGWAKPQATEGINQLARFLFLKQGWSEVVREDSTV